MGHAAIGVIADTILENASPRTWITQLQRCFLLKGKKKRLFVLARWFVLFHDTLSDIFNSKFRILAEVPKMFKLFIYMTWYAYTCEKGT